MKTKLIALGFLLLTGTAFGQGQSGYSTAVNVKPKVTSPAALPATAVDGDARVSVSDTSWYIYGGGMWNLAGGGGGGGVTSVFGRSGVVTAVSGDYTTSLVTEAANLYFTEARVRASLLTGFVAGAGTCSAADSVLQCLQKLQGTNSAQLADTDGLYDLKNTGDATKKQHWDLSGQSTATTATIAPLNTQNQTYNIQPNVDATANILTQNGTTGQVFIGNNTSIAGSNAGVQYSSTVANRGQYKAHSYAASAAAVAGVATLTSRSGTIAVNNSIGINEDYSKWTAQAAATTVGSAPISGTFAFKSAGTINALTVPTGFHIQTTNLAGTLGEKLFVNSEGILQLPAYGVGVAEFDASGNISSSSLSANLAASLSDETGTAFAVFSDSPALTGIPTVPTAAPGTGGTQAASQAYADASSDAAVSGGVNYAVAGYNATGHLYSIPNTSHTDYNGLYSNIQIPGAGDQYALNLDMTTGVAPASVNGLRINNQSESTTNNTLVDLNNAAPVGDSFSGMRLFNSGNAVNGLIMETVNNSGNFGNNLRLVEASNSGAGPGGLLYNVSNSGTMSGDLSLLNMSDSGIITGNSQLANFARNGLTTGDFGAISASLNSNVTGNVNMMTLGINGAPTIGGGLLGANIYSNADVTNNVFMMSLSATGSAVDKQGLGISLGGTNTGDVSGENINLTGSAANNVTGMSINVDNITSPNKKVGLNVSGGASNLDFQIDTSVYMPAAFDSQNRIGGSLGVAAGFPLIAKPIFGNNLGMQMQFDDDATADNTLGAGNSLGYSITGFLNQIVGTAGKTFDTVNYMAAGGSNPSGAGTVVDLNMFRALGVLNAGGTLAATNLRGFYVDPAFDGSVSATNKWGFINASSTADNWFKKNVVIGGSTGLPEAGQVLDATGPIRLRDLTTAGYVTTDASGHLSSVAIPSGTSPLTTKGDIYTHDATVDARLPVGTDTYILSANSAQATGLEWIPAPSAPVSSVFGRTGAVVSANGDYTASQVTNVPAGNIAAITVQAAINELDSEKQAGPISGDATTPSTASGVLTLATVNGNVGSFGLADNVSQFTVNAKGLITAAANVPIQITESQVTNLVADLALKAPLASPALTGVPTAPTAAGGTSTTQLATTAFVQQEISSSSVLISNISGNTTGAGASKTYFGDTTGGTFTFTLPAAASFSGVKFIVKNIGVTNAITVAMTGGDTIDGEAGESISAHAARSYQSNGTNWFILE